MRKYIQTINKKINLIFNESSCLLEEKIERERGSYKFINSYESIQHVYPSNTNTYEINCNLKKIINKNMGCKRDSMERPLVNIYKFWNFVNRFLVGVDLNFWNLDACCIFC